MAIDARDVAAFYGTALGRMTSGLLGQKLLEIWPDAAGQSILGLGFAGPYLQLWRPKARHCVAAVPRATKPAAWPPGRASLSCVVEDEALPFADISFDRILLIHGLEQADDARRALREAWRLLKDDGRIAVVVPNRRGLWAYAEHGPFGDGRPFSQGQLARLLGELFFHVERQDCALFAPPLHWRANLRAFAAIERAGHRLAPQFAGLNIAEARKDLHAVIPLCRKATGRRVLVDAG
jgi:SAM-dependent methyltransferase